MTGLRVGILGPLTVTVNGRPATPSAPRLRTVLAVLALSAGRPVPLDHLAAVVWGEDLPIDTRRTVTVYLTRLRCLLGRRSIRTEPAGYTLVIDPDDVDALRFAGLVEAAAAAGPATERVLLGAALGLWRGPPLADVPSGWLAEVEATRLTELRLDALERRITLDLDAGTGAGLDAELRDLIARHPFREHFWAHLMTVLNRSGRRAEALAVYQRLYRLLDDELGVEPGPAARAAHREVLGGDPPAPIICDCYGSGPGHHDRRLHPGPDGRAVRLECPAQVVQQRALNRR
ncbi:AfsR/SARP family transcriptional regulator [Actinoplanes sp. NBRC 103695]|uniref:AfsR/SARP family transcriptional regulator n=1 Tax=Actinoplanes sp. NBRC 103695 TaxID=3032202 RepID=UPI0024A0E1AC|nr:AfsR/SARP family transcriptional regulator [Actinoplanes sp. NBRC 103695]GLZ01360.1 hypothetical protein Acsp02_86110 [Actinoplanes sp. NBRC 103695]